MTEPFRSGGVGFAGAGAGLVATLVFLEHHGGEIQKGALGVLAKAASLGDAHGVIAGSGVAALAGKAHGAGKVWVADDPALDAPLPQPRVDVLEQVVKEGAYDTVLFAASVLAADVAAGLAARLDAGLNWDLVDLERARRHASSERARPSATRSTSRSAGRASPGSR